MASWRALKPVVPVLTIALVIMSGLIAYQGYSKIQAQQNDAWPTATFNALTKVAVGICHGNFTSFAANTDIYSEMKWNDPHGNWTLNDSGVFTNPAYPTTFFVLASGMELSCPTAL